MRDRYKNEMDKVLERPGGRSDDCCMDFESWEEQQKDRTRGVNAEPTEGFRDGVKSVKRMHPDHYIPNN
jgi:hypothetical protein